MFLIFSIVQLNYDDQDLVVEEAGVPNFQSIVQLNYDDQDLVVEEAGVPNFQYCTVKL